MERPKSFQTIKRTISNRRLGNGAFKSPSDSGVNTLLLSPGRSANALEALVLVALEGLGPLLHDLGLVYRCHLRHYINSMVQ